MKKNLQILLMGSVLLVTACKKSNDKPALPDPELQKKYPVTLAVSAFTETVGAMKSASVPQTLSEALATYISVLYCRIYDNATGNMVYSTDQSQGVQGFGSVAGMFLPGTYTAVFVGSQSAIQVNADGSTLFSNASFFAGQNSPLTDTFYKKINFTVINKPDTQFPEIIQVKLERLIAGLNVVIEDAIPAGPSRIEVILPEDQYTFKFSDESRSGIINRVLNFPLVAADVAAVNKTLQTYAFRVNTPVSVIIRVYNAGNVILYEKSIPNVTFFANKTTTLSGKLFNTKVGFAVTVNPVWDTPVPVTKF